MEGGKHVQFHSTAGGVQTDLADSGGCKVSK